MKFDWKNHLINFALIVFSILMAFQLERCASDSREQELVEAHLEAIREETRFNISSHERAIEGQKQQRQCWIPSWG